MTAGLARPKCSCRRHFRGRWKFRVNQKSESSQQKLEASDEENYSKKAVDCGCRKVSAAQLRSERSTEDRRACVERQSRWKTPSDAEVSDERRHRIDEDENSGNRGRGFGVRPPAVQKQGRNENAATHPGEPGEQANAAAGEQGEGKARRRYGVFHRFATENEWKAADEKQRA